MFNNLLEMLEKKNCDYTIEKTNGVRIIEFYKGNDLMSFSDKFLNSLPEEFCEELLDSIMNW